MGPLGSSKYCTRDTGRHWWMAGAPPEQQGPYRKRPAHVIEQSDSPPPPPAVRYPTATICSSIIPRCGPRVLHARARPHAAAVCTAVQAPRKQLQLPEQWQVVLVVGRSGTGKSTALRQLAPYGWLEQNKQPVVWHAHKAIVSQFGAQPEAGSEWLSLVGLNSIPSWSHPHHALSTGQAYRAELARRLQDAQQRQCGLLLDDFGCFLDPQSAACCAASLGKALRRLDQTQRAIICCSDSQIAHWLQPDVLVVLGDGGTAEVVLNPAVGALPEVSVAMCSTGTETEAWTIQQTRPFVQLEGWITPSSRWDQSNEDTQVVLAARVETDEGTRACDAFFDTETQALCEFALPAFPPELLGVFPQDGVGMICGPSGSAKSVLLRHCFGEVTHVQWSAECSVASHFVSDSQASMVLHQVGMPVHAESMVYSSLSTGERFQADIARLIVEAPNGPIVIDEFCSTLDLWSARRLCRALAVAAVTGWVVASCRSGLISESSWVPQWVYDTSTNSCVWFAATASLGTEIGHDQPPVLPALALFAAPKITIEIRASCHSAWKLFKAHHYKSEQLSPNAEANIALATVQLPGVAGSCAAGVPVGFVATILHAAKGPTAQQAPRRAHRTVVLPEWQGLRLGSLISDAVAAYHFEKGREYFGQTVHPRQGGHRDRSPLWEGTQWNHVTSLYKVESWKQRNSGTCVQHKQPRFMYSHRYIGHEHQRRPSNLLGPVERGPSGASRKEEQDAALARKVAMEAVPPEEMFKAQLDLYSKFDMHGMPTHDAAGVALSKNATKKLKKSRDKQERTFAKKHTNKTGGDTEIFDNAQ